MCEENHIESFAPALPGWQAVYGRDTDKEDVSLYWTKPLAGWAVVTNIDGEGVSAIRGMTASDGDHVGDLSMTPNFLGIIGPGEKPADLWWAYNEWLERRKGDSGRG